MKAIGYARVSTTDQADNGSSLESQESRIRAWAEANGADLLTIHVDRGISGAKASNRPALQAALAQACKQKAALVCFSLSRLSRSVKDCCDIGQRLNRAGADLVSLSERLDTTSASGKLLFHLMAAFGEFERAIISERTKAVMGHLRTKGRRISGSIPYGYTLAEDGENLVPLPAEQKTIRLILTLRSQGRSLRAIAAHLESQGIRAKSGNTWTPQTIAGIIGRQKKIATKKVA